MASSSTNLRGYRFGLFEVSVESRELYRNGHRVKLQEQPFQLLLLLVENAGNIVERDAIQQHLWPENTFVDYGQSVGTAITKLRQALGDEATNPRFVETIPRRGYRFIAPVLPIELPEQNAPEESPSPTEPLVDPLPVEPTPKEQAAGTPASSSFIRRNSRLLLLTSATFLLGVAAFAIYLHQQKPVFAVAPKDIIVLADFENTTGDSVFNDTLKQALAVGMQQSPLLHLLADRRAAMLVRQMGHSPEERITGKSALELCKRAGGKVEIQGSISTVGAGYLVGLAAIRCDTGRLVVHQEAEAVDKSDVIEALGKASTQLRERLGESLPSVQKYNAPLEQATTSSLDALNAYGKALSTWDAKGDVASIPFFLEAVKLDPNFAMAYSGLSAIYHNLGKTELAAESTTKAYQLSSHVTETERASIEARYYLYVTQEIEKALAVYKNLARDYPDSPGSYNHLATTYQHLGDDDKAIENFREAIRLDPTRANSYAALAECLLNLNKLQEADEALKTASGRGLRTDYLVQQEYRLAFLREDQAGMLHALQQAQIMPDAKAEMFFEQSKYAAYHGHMQQATQLARSASEAAVQAGDKESAASYLGQAAIANAEVGLIAEAGSLIQQARALDDHQPTFSQAAVVLAITGDTKQAAATADELNNKFPQGTLVQSFWLPVIRENLNLHARRLTATSTVRPNAIDRAVAEETSLSSIYPAFVRGKLLLSEKNANAADVEFKKVLDEPGKANCLLIGALSELDHARALAISGNSAEAKASYQHFLQIWNTADPNIPLLQEAKRELSRL